MRTQDRVENRDFEMVVRTQATRGVNRNRVSIQVDVIAVCLE